MMIPTSDLGISIRHAAASFGIIKGTILYEKTIQ